MQLLEPVELLRRMVEIESLSGNERSVADFLVEQMRAAGFDATVDGAGNAIGIKDGWISH